MADTESLRKFDYQFLDAIRDVESELFTGQNPLFRSMLISVLDHDISRESHGLSEQEQLKRQEEHTRRLGEFNKLSGALKTHLIARLSIEELFKLVEETGAREVETQASAAISMKTISSLRFVW